jgi:predicted alpha/beta superfamily hydrolase
MKRFTNPLRIVFWSVALLCLVVLGFHAQTGSAIGNASPPIKHTLTGNIKIHADFESRFLPANRRLVVYLPPDYENNKSRRYPVLYLQDGQNMFDAATSFLPGKEWHMDEEAQTLIAQRAIEPLIIVGISSSGLARVNEFTPPTTEGPRRGGLADLYGRMLVEEIKPFIDGCYRTITAPAGTALGGTSLGGLATLYLGLKYKDVFGKLAIISPAAFWDDEMISRYVRSLPARTNQLIYLTVGTSDQLEFLNSTRNLREAIISKGWKEGSDFRYLEVEGGQHSPGERAVRVENALRFLSPALDKRSRKKPGA